MLNFLNFMLSMLKKTLNKLIFRNRYIKIKIKGNSMYPNFLENETYIIDKKIDFSKLVRMQPILFLCDIHKIFHLKRLIAFSGEKVTIIDGKIYVENELMSDIDYGESKLSLIVSKNSFFCISDNFNSLGKNCDSITNGSISKEKIIGAILD